MAPLTISTDKTLSSGIPLPLATPLSPSTNDVRTILFQIQFVAHKSSNVVHAIATREAQLKEAAPSSSPLPKSIPPGELSTIKALLDDIWQAAVPLTGSSFLLASASLLLRHRIFKIVRDVARYLDVVAVELEAWLGERGGEQDPPTPTSLKDVSNDVDAVQGNKATDQSIPPSHVSIVLDVMLALLEASSGILLCTSRSRLPGRHSRNSSTSSTSSRSPGRGHTAEESKEAVSRSLDRARFQRHIYNPEIEGLSAEYAEAGPLGFRTLEEHVMGLTSYLWFDFGSGTAEMEARPEGEGGGDISGGSYTGCAW